MSLSAPCQASRSNMCNIGLNYIVSNSVHYLMNHFQYFIKHVVKRFPQAQAKHDESDSNTLWCIERKNPAASELPPPPEAEAIEGDTLRALGYDSAGGRITTPPVSL